MSIVGTHYLSFIQFQSGRRFMEGQNYNQVELIRCGKKNRIKLLLQNNQLINLFGFVWYRGLDWIENDKSSNPTIVGED